MRYEKEGVEEKDLRKMDNDVPYRNRDTVGNGVSRKETSEMIKQKVGLVVFWIGVIWMIAWVIISKGIFGPLAYSLTTEEINQTIWAFTGPLNILSGVSPLLGAMVAGVGISLYAGAKGSTAWKVGIGLFIMLFIPLSSIFIPLRYSVLEDP